MRSYILVFFKGDKVRYFVNQGNQKSIRIEVVINRNLYPTI